jgi:hypothetical protein
VSVYFEIRGVPVWNPASTVGVFYADQLEAAARFARLESGLSSLSADRFVVDPTVFGALINQLISTYDGSNHTVLRHQLRGILAPALVMLSRAGISYATSTDDALRDDVSLLDSAMSA